MTLPPIDVKRLSRKRREGPLERDIERKVCQYAERKGLPNEKFTSPAKRSVPDRIFYLGMSRHFFIEFKQLGKRPTVKQAKDHERRIARGDWVFVADSVEYGKLLIDVMEAIHK